jgi:hypothetical protein
VAVVQKWSFCRGFSIKIGVKISLPRLCPAVVDRWPLLTGGRYSELAVNTGLTVQSNYCTMATLGTQKKWPLYRGGRSVEGFQSKLVSRLACPDFVRPLLTGGHYSEVVINTGLTVQSNYCTMATHGTQKKWPLFKSGCN